MRGPACILLVEDNRVDVELTLDAFGEAWPKNTVHVAGDGSEALDYIFGEGAYADRGRYPAPDIVLLDLRLPGIDGFEVLKRVKSTPVLRRLPIVVLSSSGEEGDRARSYDSGANSYLVKPACCTGFREIVRSATDYWLSLNLGPPKEAS